MIPINVYLNDEAEELIMNLTAQGFYGETYDLKMKMLLAFEKSLDEIIINTFRRELEK